MATTSLWAVRGTIRDVVAYVKDPNKTANPDYDLKNVLTYAADNDKTEKQYYVTGLNCSPHFAFERMMATKERYGKRGGIVGYHGYQSFKLGELTPEECHKIGVLTAKRMWGDRFEVIVATHVKGSSALHNHFVINSVSFKDGKKYRWQKGSYRQLRRVSDELCRQHQLSIIENPMPKKVPRQIWIAEKQGKVTHASILRHDIDRAIRSNISFKYFLQALEYLGYVVVRNGDYKHISVITEVWSKPVRIDSLGANYTLEAIERRIRDNLHKDPVPHIRKPQRRVACELEKQMKAMERYSTIEILFMIFFELMGIPYDDPFTKEQRMPPKYEIASPYFAQEAINNDRYCREIRLMSWYELHTTEDVTAFRDKRKAALQNLEREKKAVDNRRRRLTDPEEKQKNSAERSAITKKMTNVRREMNLADDILSDSIRLAKVIAAEKACEERLVLDRTKQNTKNRRDKMYKKLKERITETTQYYLLRNVHPRAEQPFQVRDDEEMQELVESIRMNGVLNPLIVTQRRGGYEIVSGHRRYAACQKLGVETVPVIVRDLDPDEATLCMIDSNLHREHLLPSEKAYAYKAKMEVLNRKGQRYGQTSSQPATKWDAATEIGKATNESRDQVFRYIRLTNLIKPLMDIVDSGRIAFTPAVELSYLPHELQDKVVEIFERDEATPSYAQTVRFRRFHSEGKLTADTIEDIMAKPKANQKETVKFSYERIARFFPPNYSTKQMEDAIVRILEERRREPSRLRDEAERG